MPAPFKPFLASNPFGKEPLDFIKSTFDFVDEREDGGLDKSLHPGLHFGPWLFNFAQTKSTPVGNLGVEGTDEAIPSAVFLATGHGLSDGDQIRLETAEVLPTGFTNVAYYYVVESTGETFKLAATLAGLPLPFTDVGQGSLVGFKRGIPFDFTDWFVAAWVKANPNDSDEFKLLDLAPTFSTIVPGQVIIELDAADTFDLTSAKAYWDMVMSSTTPPVERTGLWSSGRFDINKAVTHI